MRTYTDAEKREHVSACLKSGQSIASYGRTVGVPSSNLYTWLKKPEFRSENSFLPLVCQSPERHSVESYPDRSSSGGSIEVFLPHGIVLKVAV